MGISYIRVRTGDCPLFEFRGVTFVVRDSGIGIRPEDQDRVFTQQADGSSTRSREGTGMRLMLAQKLAGLSGGRLWFDSEQVPGGGTTFLLSLPVGHHRMERT